MHKNICTFYLTVLRVIVWPVTIPPSLLSSPTLGLMPFLWQYFHVHTGNLLDLWSWLSNWQSAGSTLKPVSVSVCVCLSVCLSLWLSACVRARFLQCICVCTLYRLFHITQVIIKILAGAAATAAASLINCGSGSLTTSFPCSTRPQQQQQLLLQQQQHV